MSQMISCKEMKPLLKAARRAGWIEDWGKGGGTVKVRPGKGFPWVQLHGSPRNPGNELKAKRGELRRLGLRV